MTALLLTVAVEVPTVAVFFPRQRFTMALTCLVTTSATHVVLFGCSFSGAVLRTVGLVIAEAFALIAEAVVYTTISRPHDLPRALMASAAANALSFAASLLMPLFV